MREDFHACATNKDGLRYVCIACSRIETVVNRESNPQRYRDRKRKSWLKQHGLTEASYADMLARQGGKCAICFRSIEGRTIRLRANIDHDHETGKLRELLCRPCNVSLGGFQDSPILLRRAAEYIEKHKHER